MRHTNRIVHRLGAVVATMARQRMVSVILAAVLLALTASPGRGAGPGPGNLKLEASLPLGLVAFDVIIDGTIAYVATEKGLTIVDISNPVGPVVLGAALSVKGNASRGLAKKGSYVYLAAAKAGMQVIDVSNPKAPATVAIANEGGDIFQVAVHPTANAAYAASYRGQVLVWDISNPLKPRLTQKLGAIASRTDNEKNMLHMRNLKEGGSAYVTGVSAAGDYVFAGDWNYGALFAWKSSPDPLHLTFAGRHRTICLYRTVADPTRNVVYMLVTWARWTGVYTLPLSLLDPFESTAWDTCEACGEELLGMAADGGGIGLSPNGKYVIAAGGRGNGELRVIDVRDPVNLVSVAVVPLGKHQLGNSEGMGVVAKGNFLYVAAGMLGLRVYSFPGLSN